MSDETTCRCTMCTHLINIEMIDKHPVGTCRVFGQSREANLLRPDCEHWVFTSMPAENRVQRGAA